MPLDKRGLKRCDARLMDGELVKQIAQAYLGSYWQARLADSGASPEALNLAFYDSFLHNIKLYPATRIKKRYLKRKLRPHLFGRFSVRTQKDTGTVTIRLEPLTKETLPADLAAVKAALRDLETHCRTLQVELSDTANGIPQTYRDQADLVPVLRIIIEVPIKNLLSPGRLPLSPIARGAVSTNPNAVRMEAQTCPHCKAEHLIVYGRKSHSQDSDTIPFACRQCGRVELCAFGIPELVSYRIDLAERMPRRLRWAHAKQAADWERSSQSWNQSFPKNVPTVYWLAAVSFLVPAALLVYAWFADEKFTFPAFRVARVLASLCCAFYGMALLALAREATEVREKAAALGLAATFATMIPVCVALWN